MNDQYNAVIKSVELLAASFEQQKVLLPEFADIPDDVVSEFENAFLLLPQLIESAVFSNNCIAALLRTYNEMQWCLRNVDLDDFSSDEWNKVRSLAKEVLILARV